jgi:ring-1,2-phenylacetyl-CoA epoxidase subunit PaaC
LGFAWPGILPARASLRLPGTRPSAWCSTKQVWPGARGAVSGTGGRDGLHGEEMGHLLAELQYMQRTYPDMKW